MSEAILKGRPLLVSISGGKDSTAMALHLAECGHDFQAVFMDTGWEHSHTYRYLDEVLEPLFGPILRLAGEFPMVELIRKKAMFPSRVRRFCTSELKVKPIRRHCVDVFLETGERPVSAVGIRAQESRSRAAMEEWEEQDEATVWRPILTWSFEDVVDIHSRHGVTPNPLYLAGASRVGCWPCIHARKSEVRRLAQIDPERVDLIRSLEAEITAAADQRAADKGVVNQHPRTWFQGRGPAELGGRAGAMPIDQVVEWAQTGRGGRQFELLEAPEDEGCMRWGLCDHPPTEEDPDGE